MDGVQIWISFAQFVLTLVVLLITGQRALSKAEASIRDDIHNHRKELDELRIADLRNMGEALTGVRTKLFEVEIWTRDALTQYALRSSVENMSTRLERQISASEERLTDAVGKLDVKLDLAARRAETHKGE